MAWLAGNLKLNHFLAALTGVVGLGIAGVFVATLKDTPEPPPEPRPLVEDEAPSPEARAGVILNRAPDGAPVDASATTAPPSAAPTGLSAAQREVLAWARKPMSSAKIKDVSKGRPYKINVYQDDPGQGANRAKVDLDRDDRWDEKYTFEPGGGVTRKVAPADDEDYSEVYRLTEAGWTAD